MQQHNQTPQEQFQIHCLISETRENSVMQFIITSPDQHVIDDVYIPYPCGRYNNNKALPH